MAVKGARATDTTIGRRGLLGGGLAAGALAGAGLRPRRARADSPVALTLAVWGAQAEEEAFKSVIDKYQALQPNVTIRLEVNGNSMQLYQLVDTGAKRPIYSGSSISRSGVMRAPTHSSI
jgi:ABC-type glycerol-3-phosphate transport system substrate-binding protein